MELNQWWLDKKLDELLTNFRYESSTGRGARALMRHHIDALKAELLPFINGLLKEK